MAHLDVGHDAPVRLRNAITATSCAATTQRQNAIPSGAPDMEDVHKYFRGLKKA